MLDRCSVIASRTGWMSTDRDLTPQGCVALVNVSAMIELELDLGVYDDPAGLQWNAGPLKR